MKVITLVVAALLLTIPEGATAAEREEGQKSKGAQKTLILLNSIGINSKEVRDLVTTIDAEIDYKKGYLHLVQREMPGGHKLTLRYRTSSKSSYRDPRSNKRLELALTPAEDSTFSNFEVIARTDSFSVNYRLKF